MQLTKLGIYTFLRVTFVLLNLNFLERIYKSNKSFKIMQLKQKFNFKLERDVIKVNDTLLERKFKSDS